MPCLPSILALACACFACSPSNADPGDVDAGSGAACSGKGSCPSYRCVCLDGSSGDLQSCAEGRCWTADEACGFVCADHQGIQASNQVPNVNASDVCGAVYRKQSALACAVGPYGLCQYFPDQGECEAGLDAYLACLSAQGTASCASDGSVVWSGGCVKDFSSCADGGVSDASAD